MVSETKLLGNIENYIFRTQNPQKPVCPICGKEIRDDLRLIVCPLCRKPFHKDHLIGCLKEKGERCPNCEQELTLNDLFLNCI
ncbi:MAG: hypothetical protein GF364_08400 [Candidatus Lokiarchaeota archaeon]|nr:hypothetical protein [Candidatus Lokiarchaeota archaeon]